MNAHRQFFVLLLLASCCCAQESTATGSTGIPSIDVVVGQDFLQDAVDDIPDGGIINLIYEDQNVLDEEIFIEDKSVTIKGRGKNGPRLLVDADAVFDAAFNIYLLGMVKFVDFNFENFPKQLIEVFPSTAAEKTITGSLEVESCRFKNITETVIVLHLDLDLLFSNLVVNDCDFIGNGAAIASESFYKTGTPEERLLRITNTRFVRQTGATNAAALSVLAVDGESSTDKGPPEEGPPSVDIVNCTFSENSLGGVNMEGISRLKVLGSIFEKNEVTEFSPFGGAMDLRNCYFVEVRTSRFSNNKALTGGGAVAISTAKITVMSKVVFEGNSCDEDGVGGGFYWEDHEANLGAGGFGDVEVEFQWSVDITNCTFVGNVAYQGGGAFAMGRNVNGEILGGFRVAKSFFIGNEAVDAAGGFGFWSDSVLRLGSTDFIGNKADRGGGVALALSGTGILSKDFFYNNTAAVAGGGLFALSLKSMDIKESSFVKSFASEGGAMMLDGVQQTEIRTTTFVENYATLGGGLLHVARSLIQNRLKLDASTFEGNTASILPEYQNLDGLRELLKGGAGAMALLGLENPDKGSLDAEITGTKFVRNKADGGGAMFVATNKGSTFSDLHVKVSLCEFDGNIALEAGGIMLVDKVNGIEVQCDAGGPYKTLDALFPTFCSNWNTTRAPPPQNHTNQVTYVKTGIPIPFGEAIASFLVGRLEASPNKTTGNLSGKPLPEISVLPFDLFGQSMTSPILGRAIEMRSVTDDADLTLTGTTVAKAVNGTAIFDGLTIIGDPGNFVVNITSQLAESLATPKTFVSLEVELRECVLGEVAQDNSLFGCLLCSNGLYSFNRMNSTCDPCPENANCSASVGEKGVPERRPVVPLDGYWHSTPFSIQMHLCLSDDACHFENRVENLQSFVVEDNIQCREGHTGVLCGACEEGYGHSSVGECSRCQPTWIYVMIIGSIMILSLFLVIATLRGNLLMEREEQHLGSQVYSLDEHPENIECSEAQAQGEKSRPSNMRGLRVGRANGTALQERQSLNLASLSSVSVLERAVGEENEGENDDPGLKVAELMKIMINFAQVTGTAFIIDFDWPEGIKQMVGIQDLVSATSGVWTATECAMPENAMVSKSMFSLILSMSTPILISILLVCFWFARAVYVHIKITPLKFQAYLTPRLLVTAWSVVFFFYDSWTESFMKLMYCPSVDVYDQSQPYFEFANSTSRVWAQDTAVTCFEGVHKGLFFGVALPGLILFSFGVPLAMLMFIVYNRDRLTNPRFRLFYGFMYLNYDIEYAYWESAIMVRKAFIVAIAVLAHSLGKSLQGILMLGVMFLAVVAHTITRPLPLDLLDNMETWSLVTTACTFFAAVVFSDAEVSEVGRLLLSIFVYTVNLLFVLHFTATFVRAVHEYVISYKEEEEEEGGQRDLPDQNIGFFKKVWYLLVTKTIRILRRYAQKLRRTSSGTIV
ncbi:hypothetical protein BSKO_12654 [Bryopsis sp. KO-2023]|nr:hypothetical protein BSKO_12654 [Bryopsis sp. KO-2023]